MKPGAETTTTLNGQQWKQMMQASAIVLERKKKEVDALNVFPVPDGDTGTNMNLTIQSAVKEAEKTSGESVAEVMTAVSMGSLMGARGNSGVILSQILRGIAKGFDGCKTVSGKEVAQALKAGVDTAYKAVMKPVEGTILTVSREAAKGAVAIAKQGASPLEVLQEAFDKGQQTLQRTPEMLPVLKKAGVVDAGGQGLLYIFKGWIMALEGNVDFSEFSTTSVIAATQSALSGSKIRAVGSLEFPYCTELLVKGRNLSVARIQNDLNGLGDSLLVVGTDSVVKIHVHVQNPGKILDYALQWGSLHEVGIHNMLEQNEAIAHAQKSGNSGMALTSEVDPTVGAEQAIKENGVVAVTMGRGIAEIYKSLGVDEVVFGGQTMNPSTEDLAAAVRNVAAKNVYILPNNGNIIMAANQVKELVKDRSVFVIPSKSIPQGISALVNYDPDNTPVDNSRAMEQGLSLIRTGEVTYSVRASEFGDIKIAEGDILGLVEDVIQVADRDIPTVAKAILEKMEWRKHDLVTIFYGEEVSEDEAAQLKDWMQKEDPKVEVELYAGKQPLYYYIIGVE